MAPAIPPATPPPPTVGFSYPRIFKTITVTIAANAEISTIVKIRFFFIFLPVIQSYLYSYDELSFKFSKKPMHKCSIDLFQHRFWQTLVVCSIFYNVAPIAVLVFKLEP